ncbi:MULTISPECIES: hypothetical protein [Flammeovirga]|uniref:hypothetical protein n=1 Tax=Flammeovirga TaxID=59739 RepID=UPI0008061CCE|nr:MULTISPECIES: hypothetical protein [Flammeovirga]ANQ48597.1 hypothetical protein MY04_1220 [Flammeovirga sp. MY04]MBB3696486.1 putative metal-dependent RNase [Flammeovirga yaeyamensis]NMF33167.1 hypothetical protein [Flammeovirga yaeyamensis]
MGYIKEPKGVTLVVEKKPLTSEAEKSIKDFIQKSKKRNKELLEKLSFGKK